MGLQAGLEHRHPGVIENKASTHSSDEIEFQLGHTSSTELSGVTMLECLIEATGFSKWLAR
jgi:hypothetical protein